MAICYKLADSEVIQEKYLRKDGDGELLPGENKYLGVARFIRAIADFSQIELAEIYAIAQELELLASASAKDFEQTVMLKIILQKELK